MVPGYHMTNLIEPAGRVEGILRPVLPTCHNFALDRIPARHTQQSPLPPSRPVPDLSPILNCSSCYHPFFFFSCSFPYFLFCGVSAVSFQRVGTTGHLDFFVGRSVCVFRALLRHGLPNLRYRRSQRAVRSFAALGGRVR